MEAPNKAIHEKVFLLERGKTALKSTSAKISQTHHKQNKTKGKDAMELNSLSLLRIYPMSRLCKKDKHTKNMLIKLEQRSR
jgi:hypothetical protein